MNTVDERKSMPSASSFSRYQKCPGSWKLEQSAKELGQVAHTASKDANRGTRIHAWLALTDEERKLVEQLLRLPIEERNAALAKIEKGLVNISEQDVSDGSNLKDRADEQVRRIFSDQSYTELKEKRAWLK